MKQRVFFLIIFLLFSGFSLFGEEFSHKYTTGEKYRIVASGDQNVFINGNFDHRGEFLNKIAVEILSSNNQFAEISASFQYSEKTTLETGSFVMQSEHFSKFKRDKQGKDTVASQYLYPIFRSIPQFPTKDIQPGFKWEAMAEEAHDLKPIFGIETPYVVPFKVNFTYIGNTTVKDRKNAQFKVEYSYVHDLTMKPKTQTDVYPVRFIGKIVMIYNWDIDFGKVQSYNDEYHIMYIMSNGYYMEFIGTSKGETFISEPLDKEQTKDDIEQDLKDEEVEDVTVEEVNEGIKLTLDNIQFEPESDILLLSEKQKLDKISDILKKYPDRDLLVIGHTARRGTVEGQKKLSIARAKAVADYLLKKNVRTASQMVTQGRGATEPVADNSTEEGRIKNRRVEIILLEN